MISNEIRLTYRARHLLALPTSTLVKDSNNNIVAHTATSYDEVYDEVAYPLPPYSSVTQWTDPGTSARGNATTTSRWLNFDGSTFSTFPAGTYLFTHAQYDQCGSVRRVWDARDTDLTNPTLVEYSATYAFAYPTLNTSADPDGSGPLSALTTATEYDFSTGLVTATTDANGRITSFEYDDPLNRIKKVIRATGDALVKNQTSYAYDDSSRTITVTSDLNGFDDNLLKTVTIYDGLGRTAETRQYESSTNYIATRYQYDTSGRLFKTSDPFRPVAPDSETPAWTITAFDALSRVLNVTTPDNALISTSYSGNRVLVKDQSEKQRLSQSDALGRLTGVWEITPSDSATEGVSFPDHSEVTAGYRTSYGYDALDNLVDVTQRIGTAGTTQTRTFVYDSLKRLTSAASLESGTISYQYDKNGNLTQKTDARSLAVTTTYIYDALNRVTNRNYSDDTPDVLYTYDASATDNFGKGRLTSVSSSVSSYSYLKYDALGRVLIGNQKTGSPDYTISYEYDRAGNMTSQTYPSGRVVKSKFDSAGRLAGVKNQATGLYYAGAASDSTNRFKYSAHGAITDMKLGNALWEHTIFNFRLQPTEIRLGTAQGGIDRLKLSYGYGTTDNNGNVRSQTITVPTVDGITGFTATQTYSYDSLNRLASAQESGTGWTQNFTYDRYGNRNFAAGTTLPAQLNASNNPIINPNNNRIDVAASGQTSYSYDGAGNLTHDHNVAGHSFAYDGENKQKSYDGGASAGGGASYYYDGDGRRVKKVVGGSPMTTTVFIYNISGHLVAEYTDVAPSSPGGTSYLTSDTLGSPRIITGPNQDVRARHDYLPFGEELFELQGIRSLPQGYTGDSSRQKFTSYERDNETELDFAQARYYSSRQGRFTSADPLMASARLANPQSWNRYTYVLNRPLSLIDPTGMGDCTPLTPCQEVSLEEASRSSGGLLQETVTINISDQTPLETTNLSMIENLALGTGQVASDTVIGAGKFGYNTVFGTANLINAPFDYGLSFFTSFQFGQNELYQASTPGQQGAMYGMMIGGVLAGGFGGGGITSASGSTFRFSQTTASAEFSTSGLFSGRTIGGVAADLRSGALSPSQVPVGFLESGGTNLIVNTRSSLALQRAGIPQSQWNFINYTGNPVVEANIANRLGRNGLTNRGTDVLRILGAGRNASSLR